MSENGAIVYVCGGGAHDWNLPLDMAFVVRLPCRGIVHQTIVVFCVLDEMRILFRTKEIFSIRLDILQTLSQEINEHANDRVLAGHGTLPRLSENKPYFAGSLIQDDKHPYRLQAN